jgi:ketosteroid isomerase-like protein
MRGVLARRLVLGLFLVTSAGSLDAQVVPRAPTPDWERERREFTAEMLRDYNALIREWSDALVQGNARTVISLYAEGAYLLLPGGEPLQGREAIERFLTGRQVDVIELRTGLVDFSASARMAYALGPFWYQVRDPSGMLHTVTGTLVTVMIMERNRWRIRSHVFQPAPAAVVSEE